MNEPRTYELEIGGKTLTIQHGILAQQANGAVTVRLGDTVVLVTACMADAREGLDFFPLTIDYEERLYAVGKIPGGFPRREGRASNDGILAMRQTDRPLRRSSPRAFARTSRSSQRRSRRTAKTSRTRSSPSAPARRS